MIVEAEKRGQIKPNVSTIVEPTSGNTGIGCAMIAASRGYDVVIVMPDKCSMERRIIIRAFGAKLVLVDASKGLVGAIKKAEEIVSEIGENAFMLKQFSNPDNPCLLYTSPSPRDLSTSRMPSSA